MPLAEAQAEWVADLLGGGRRYRRRRRCGGDRARGREDAKRFVASKRQRSRSTSIPTCARSGASESGLRSGLDDGAGSAAARAARQRSRASCAMRAGPGAAAMRSAARAARRASAGVRRLKPPSILGCALGLRCRLLAHQTSQIAPKTGIFSTTSRKKIGQNPSSRLSVESSVAQARPRQAPRREPPRARGGSRSGRAGSARSRRSRPLVTALVEVVVDPGHRPALPVLLQRRPASSARRRAGGAVEADVRQLRAARAAAAGRSSLCPPSRSPRPARSAR